MIITKNKEELEIMRRAALMVSKTLGMIASEIKPGVTTLHLDGLAETYIRDNGAIPGFKGLYGCPSTLLISPNEEVVHGIPKDVAIKDGDILSIDCGAIVEGFYGDHAYTFAVGEIPVATQLLLDRTKNSLYLGIDQFRKNNRVEDIGYAIQTYCEGFGYGVVRDLVGHALGRTMHEEPQIPNYGKRGKGKKFQEGMTLAIEPMINMGTRKTRHFPDGWTIKTKDGQPSAHFEHNVALVDGEPRLLSTFDYIYEVLGIKTNEEDPYRWKD